MKFKSFIGRVINHFRPGARNLLAPHLKTVNQPPPPRARELPLKPGRPSVARPRPDGYFTHNLNPPRIGMPGRQGGRYGLRKAAKARQRQRRLAGAAA